MSRRWPPLAWQIGRKTSENSGSAHDPLEVEQKTYLPPGGVTGQRSEVSGQRERWGQILRCKVG